MTSVCHIRTNTNVDNRLVHYKKKLHSCAVVVYVPAGMFCLYSKQKTS